MSLYDDIDTDKKPESVAGWASGMKFLQSHMQLKKAATPQPKREIQRKTSTLAPVVNLQNRNKGDSTRDDSSPNSFILPTTTIVSKTDKRGPPRIGGLLSAYLSSHPDWQWDNEYDPLYPNEYDKALKDLRERRDREAEEEERRRRQEDENYNVASVTNIDSDGPYPKRDRDRERESSSGVAIAPPPNLDKIEPFEDKKGSNALSSMSAVKMVSTGSGATAAARIMAKYGYKEGQGLGKQEQGMSTALLVEKTSHRTGRIIHEKDLSGVVSMNSSRGSLLSAYIDDEENMDEEYGSNDSCQPTTTGPVDSQPGHLSNDESAGPLMQEASHRDTEQHVEPPSEVVVLKNMVGPGEVDDDLEPEVKDECLKYGQVQNVTIFQMPDVDTDDAIRIFVEFSTIDAAGKAIVDLNGRYFGGRQVRAEFYNLGRYNNLELTF